MRHGSYIIFFLYFSKQKQRTKVWGNQVRSAPKEEGRHKDAEFRVKYFQYIDAAEVKLVKCHFCMH